MNEEYLENVYNALGLQERGIQFDAFKNKVSTNEQYNQVIYDNLVQKTGNQYDRASFEVSTGLKKKEPQKDIKTTMLDSLSQSAAESSGLDWSSVTNPNPSAEKNAIGGVFGDVINNIPYGIGDYIDDSYRAISRGYSAGQTVEDSFNLLADVDEENFNSFYDSYEGYITQRESLGESDEMKSFNEIYEEEGRDTYGFFKGVANNPTALSEIIFESLGTLVNNVAVATAGSTVLTGATAGAIMGSATATPQGMVVGAAGGAVASIPYAMGAASAVTTTSQLFGQMIESELDSRGLEWSRDNVKNLVEDEEFMKTARVKAYSAGAVVGVVDALTMRLGGAVGAKILTKGGAYSKLAATAATTAVETVGGGVSQASEALVTGAPLTSGDLTMGAIL